ncbi:hypothetical protein BDV96DRAFT_159612 [Lophiotrema nucula]|uniref:Uncharacterized protein n=1 Tax=Lophiotrema nucula TaxID=690887 RepID=A0A6A5YZR5_9PLEO|nr:hypothetical protein BDV96DRAFT_159612 [Lophiotrema nucula]
MKRKRSARVGARPLKRPNQSAIATTPDVDHPVLRRLYPEVLSLRHYLLSKLPGSSKNRRRKLSQLGTSDPSQEPAATTSTCNVDSDLGSLLDSTLVGVFPTNGGTSREDAARARNRDIQSFSQHLSNYSTGGTYKPGYFLQSEVGSFSSVFARIQLARRIKPCFIY